MKQIEIYWNDLTEKAKKDILEAIGAEAEEYNWDVIPLAVIDIEEKADED